MGDRGGQRAQGRRPAPHGRARCGPCSGPPRRPCSRSRPEGRRRTSGRPAICSTTWATPRTCFTAPREVTIRKTKSTFMPVMPRLDHRVERRQVVGVDDVSNPLHRDLLPGSNSKMRKASSDQLCSSASRSVMKLPVSAQPLGIGETVVGPPELRLGPLSVFDVDDHAVPAGRFSRSSRSGFARKRNHRYSPSAGEARFGLRTQKPDALPRSHA